MGAWGEGIFSNDTALDTIGFIQDALENKADDLTFENIFDHVPYFDADNEFNIVLLFKFWCDFGQKKNIADHMQIFDVLLSERVLNCWVDPESRRKVIENLRKQCQGVLDGNIQTKYEPTLENVAVWTEKAPDEDTGLLETMVTE